MRTETVSLPADLACAVAHARVDSTAEPKALAFAPKGAIADRGGYVCFDVDMIGRRVALLAPEHATFQRRTLPEVVA